MSKLNIFDDDHVVNRDIDDPVTIDPAIRDNIVEQIQEPQVPKLRITFISFCHSDWLAITSGSLIFKFNSS